MTQEVKNIDSEAERPVIGASGRKIVYDKDGKPYVTPNEHFSHFY